MIDNENNQVNIDDLQAYIDRIRDLAHEAWLDYIRDPEQMLKFLDVVKSHVMRDYDEVYDNLCWGGMPSEYISNEEEDCDV